MESREPQVRGAAPLRPTRGPSACNAEGGETRLHHTERREPGCVAPVPGPSRRWLCPQFGRGRFPGPCWGPGQQNQCNHAALSSRSLGPAGGDGRGHRPREGRAAPALAPGALRVAWGGRGVFMESPGPTSAGAVYLPAHLPTHTPSQPHPPLTIEYSSPSLTYPPHSPPGLASSHSCSSRSSAHPPSHPLAPSCTLWHAPPVPLCPYAPL